MAPNNAMTTYIKRLPNRARAKPPAIRKTPDQVQALRELRAFANSNEIVHALSGPAGSGKTTIIAEFVQACQRTVEVTATTNKAAKVAAAVIGAEAKTIHSLLGLQPKNDETHGRTILKREREPTVEPRSLVIVDECSMVDGGLLNQIMSDAYDLDFQVLFVGDDYQLPPVFEADSPVFTGVPTSRLTRVHRQALDNPVLAFANGFRSVLDGGDMPRVRSLGDTVRLVEPERFEADMLDAFERRGDPDAVRAMAWTNKRVRELNQAIRRRLLGSDADQFAHLRDERFVASRAIKLGRNLVVPTEGEVLVLESERNIVKAAGVAVAVEAVRVLYDGRTLDLYVPTDWDAANKALSVMRSAANGLQRRVRAGERKLDEDRRAAWRAYFEVEEFFADLRPVHACTVHKSQGSTYREAFIDVADIGRCTRSDVIARLMYVATSRASHSITMMGDLPGRLYVREAA